MVRLIVSLLVLTVMAACSDVSETVNGWGNNMLTYVSAAEDDPQLSENAPVVVFETDRGRLVYQLYTSRENVFMPFIHSVDAELYNNLYIDRSVPGLLVEAGNLHTTTPFRIPADKRLDGAGAGELGIIKNDDGSFGPRLVLFRGSTMFEGGLVPPNVRIGKLVEGRDALLELRKGDVILQAYGRNFRREMP